MRACGRCRPGPPESRHDRVLARPVWGRHRVLALVVAVVKLVLGVLVIALFENSMARLRFCATSRVTWAGFGFAFLAFVSLLVA